MPKLTSNRIIANGVDYEVPKVKIQYQLPSIEKFNVGDFIGDEMIIGKIGEEVKLKNILNPLEKGKWVKIYNL